MWRRYIVLLLLVSLFLVGCGSTVNINNIPEGISKDFYTDSLIAIKEIEKIKITKFDNISEKNTNLKQFNNYLLLKEYKNGEITKEQIDKLEIDIDLNRDLTKKEEFAIDIFLYTLVYLKEYISDENNIAAKNKFEEKFNQFRTLLELQ